MNSNATQQIVNKAWGFVHVLRDDGLSYMAYTEQITFLLFLKMADQHTRPPWSRPSCMIPKGKTGERHDWRALLERDGEALETQNRAAKPPPVKTDQRTGLELGTRSAPLLPRGGSGFQACRRAPRRGTPA